MIKDVCWDNIWHVIPLGEKHIEKCDMNTANGLPICLCKCSPSIRTKGDGLVVMHNSFNRREGVEWAKRTFK